MVRGAVKVPHPRCAIVAARHEPIVGHEGQGTDNVGRSQWVDRRLRSQDDRFIRGLVKIPHPRRAIETARGNPAVRRHGHGENRAFLTG